MVLRMLRRCANTDRRRHMSRPCRPVGRRRRRRLHWRHRPWVWEGWSQERCRGPDAEDHYTLTSMQHRTGVEVVGGDELITGAGAKVKLTGSWQALPGAEGKKGDAAQRFKATGESVRDEP